MTFRVKYSLYSALWVIVWLCAGQINGWAQVTGPTSATPTSASLIQEIQQKYNVRIVGQLCTPAQTNNTSCSGDVSFIDEDLRADVTKSTWRFSTLPNPLTGGVVSTPFTTAGVVSVTLTRTSSQTVVGIPASTSATTFSLQIGTRPPPFENWKSEHIICKGTALELNPYPSGAPSGSTYLWFPDGRTTPTYSVTEGGCYSVEVFNAFGCSTQQRTQVELCPTQAGSPGAKWYFGNNAGLDFASGSPTPLTDGKVNTIEGTATISNRKGQLLFYTDGIVVFDKDGNPMKLFDPVSGSLTSASATLGGNQRSTQSALIVPKPICDGCDYEYYVYTTQDIAGTRQLTYSIVDMRRNDGKGAVVQPPRPVVPTSSTLTSTERSASVMRDRDTTYWVITHDYGSSCFRINHLTASGSGALTSTSACIGLPHDSPARGQGQMKIGPAPQSTTATPQSNTAVRPMAVIVAGNPDDPDPARRINYVEVFSFNTETGTLSGPTKTINMGPAPPTAYGVEFSPDGSKLYVSSLGATSLVNGSETQTGPSTIVQYDLSEADPASTSNVMASATLQQFGSLQIGPDGKIYVAVQSPQGATSLGVIENPNSTSSVSSTVTSPFRSATFVAEGQPLGGRTSQLGLPNQVANFNEESSSAGVSIENVCEGSPAQAQFTPLCPKIKNEYILEVRDVLTNAIVTSVARTTATSPSLGVLAPGSYTATLTTIATNTAAVGGPEECTRVTTGTGFTVVEQVDNINLGPDITRCGDNSPIVLDMGVAANFYLWVRGNQIVGRNKTLIIDPTNPANAGRYIAFATNDPSIDCFKADDIRITLFATGNLGIPPIAALCQGSTTRLTIPDAVTASFQNFTLTNGTSSTIAASPNAVFTVSTPGTYTVTGSFFRDPPLNTITCVASNTINVVAAQLPRVTPTLQQPTSCTLANGSISLNVAPTTVVVGGGTPTPGTSFTYSWSAVSGGTPVASTTGNVASSLLEGTYRVRVTDANSCSVVNDYALRANVPRLTVTPRTSDALCGDPASGTAAMVITGGVAVGTGWQGPPGVPSSISATSGTLATGLTPNLVYSFSATNDQGCVTSATASIGVSQTTTLSVADRSKCTGDTVNLVPSRLGTSDAGVTYRWNTGSTNRVLEPSTAGTYSLTATNQNNGCRGVASATVRFVAKPNVSAGSNQTSCLGGPTGPSAQTLTLTGASPGGGSWTALGGATITPQGSLTLLPSQIGQTITAFYSVTVDGCANAASKQITVRKNPQVTAPPDDEFCQNSGTELQATSTDPGVLFIWSNGTQGSRIRPNQSGTYTVRATLDGCSATDDVVVTVNPAPVFALAREAFICVGDNQQALLRVVPQSNDQTVRWTDGTTSTTLVTGTVGSYSVAVTGANGCTANAATAVIDRCEPRLLTPNAFTPNGDGNNDFFGVKSAYTLDQELRIYNRWGEVIFVSTDENPEWDGTYRGEPVQPMVYPYVVTYRSEYFPNRPAVVKRGSLLLLR